MFNQDSTSVTVRLAQSGDKVVQPTSAPTLNSLENKEPTIKKTEAPPETTKQDYSNTEISDITNKTDISATDRSGRIESDQEKMVLELFDGKYIE